MTTMREPLRRYPGVPTAHAISIENEKDISCITQIFGQATFKALRQFVNHVCRTNIDGAMDFT